jgi:2-succinyl-6-hydroxy-2,4-cyclohexadiene-1-carboxylate synthase
MSRRAYDYRANVLDVAIHEPADTESTPARRLVLVHGFTQAGAVWREFADEWAAHGYEVVAPDLPGHGATDAAHDDADLWTSASLLADVGGAGIYVGYSLGARVLLHLALTQPQVASALVLVGAKAGWDDRSIARARQRDDDALADRIDAGGVGGLPQFIDEWLDSAVNADVPESRRHRALRLTNRPAGLAASLRYCGSGVQEPLLHRLHEIDVPVLVLSGENDIPNASADAPRIADAIGPNARHVVIDGSGHSVPWSQPDAFRRVVGDFVDRCA